MNAGKRPIGSCSSVSGLCAMMDGNESTLPDWSAHDIAAILRHLLSTSVDQELSDEGLQPRDGGVLLPGHPAGKIACGTFVSHHRSSWTFGEALARRDVPREMLARIRDYAKRAMDADDALPREVAKALYVAVIAHARACGHASLSSLSATSFERLGRWCLAQRWAPPAIRIAVREGMRAE